MERLERGGRHVVLPKISTVKTSMKNRREHETTEGTEASSVLLRFNFWIFVKPMISEF